MLLLLNVLRELLLLLMVLLLLLLLHHDAAVCGVERGHGGVLHVAVVVVDRLLLRDGRKTFDLSSFEGWWD